MAAQTDAEAGPARGPTGRRRGARSSCARRAGALARLLTSPDLATLVTEAMSAGLTDAGATGAVLYLTADDATLRPAAGTGAGARATAEPEPLPADAPHPAATAVRTRHPAHAQDPARSSSVAFPLLTDGRCLGALLIVRPTTAPPDQDGTAAIEAVAAVCAHRIDRLLAPEPLPAPSVGPALDLALRRVAGATRAARLELAMSSADIGAFDWDMTTGSVLWDERLCRLFGLDPKEFDERIETFFEAVHPADRPRVERAVADSRRTGEFAVDYRIVRPDGVLRWLTAKGHVLDDREGRSTRMVGVAQDRTDERERQRRERERQRRERERREFVLTTTRAFTAGSTTRDVVDTMTGIVLPALGASALALHVEQHGRLRLAGARGYSADGMRRLGEIGRLDATTPLTAALASGRPLFITSRRRYLAAFPGTGALPEPRHHAWAVLPLTAGHAVVGTCVISYDAPRHFTEDDEAQATALSGILAQSLARARLSDERRRQMTELQRMMLPRSLPDLPGLAVAVRYLPGTAGLDVGGDWYDILPLADGRVGVVIGDVQGHSVQAAAVMGQVRTALRAYAAEGHDPATVMSRTNTMLCALDTELFATAAYVEIDGEADRARVVRAGHPYPVRIQAGGAVDEVQAAGGLPLGCEARQEYPVHEVELPPGAGLLLYTDGLVERRSVSYDASVEQLLRVLAGWSGTGSPDDPRQELELLADHVTAAAASMAERDDVAVLLVRRHHPGGCPRPAAGRRADWRIAPGDLRGAHRARHALDRELAHWGLSAVGPDAALLTGELLANAVQHTEGPVELCARHTPGTLRVDVLDHSHHRPLPPRPAVGSASLLGRGLRVVDAVADRWGWEPRGERKSVWFELGTGERREAGRP
ncbi:MULTISPECIES: SpoIIE family protein phosphatase [Streptomycetaceae]|uniref:protein-serine/threonine phosphatase n=1 Tax=Streptantibioticus cattleyicolor (strain ATCC 35852 / DSM 46488 / JCM 4925 / NBRC 14057 / NRRL 8057) TaxID=1003195 RepID=F8K0L8_STREN|nr:MULTISPECIES: SpoIIE family protein phosphatase [Streptomycetaceae]AEW97425.1 magnesium or manganese-dependent protein phosphatase [Streptantibioticus cattleyicolor NRRL 8057 = DSM 46488]MYS61867.1 SpoIIE family protein phosphatase [Streptomyces sp. SID5468]CCB77747.1 protein of unknown function [Streptantibioticus cattleyicolor NRRL 8057 = DSM 46488]